MRTDVLDIALSDSGGDGPVVLALHGWPDSSRTWAGVAPHLVAAGLRVVAPDLRATGGTRFLDAATPRDGSSAALAADALDVVDALGVERFAVLGHDWGARAAYHLAVLAPERVTAATAVSVAYQPGGRFPAPPLPQARSWWYQFFMGTDTGAAAVREDPVGFARFLWETWSPPGWFEDAEFAATAAALGSADWVAVTLNAYRARYLDDEPSDPRYDGLRERVATTDRVHVPTLVVEGAADGCTDPSASAGQERSFDDHRRVVLDGVGHFAPREAPAELARLVVEHVLPHRP